MNITKLKLGCAVAVNFAVACGLSSQAFSAGFEKSIMWGGRTGGVGGVATPYIAGSQALYFNPAGLVSDQVGQDVSLNVSPTWSQFKGPVASVGGGGAVTATSDVTGERTFKTPFGLIYGATLNENLGFGIGGYVSGGNAAKYENVALAGRPLSANLETEIQIIELAAGVGYRVTPDLKIGASWRSAFVSAKFAALAYQGGAIVNLESSTLEDQKFNGFKVGAQYKLNDRTLLGLAFRSEIEFDADGDIKARIDNGATVSQTPSASLTASSVLPMNFIVGGMHDLNESWRLMGEYVFTQYSRVDKINLKGTVAGIGNLTNLDTKWDDQHNIRLGTEYLGWAMPVRAGYVWTSQVTPDDYARPTFTPPGHAHTFTIGTGKNFELFGAPLQLDAAGEYTFSTGNGSASSPQPQITRPGDYEATSFALHMGATYAF